MPAVALPTVPLQERAVTHLFLKEQNVVVQSASPAQPWFSPHFGAFVGAQATLTGDGEAVEEEGSALSVLRST